MKDKKNNHSGSESLLLPQRQGNSTHSVGVSQDATLFILAPLHRRPFLIFFFIHPKKKK